MAETQSTYNYKVVRQFAVMTVVWGIVGMLVGVIIAAQLVWPELNFGPWLTYGRLRPLHTNAVIFAFGGCALFATSYYVVQRTGHTRLFADGLAAFTFWGWQLVILLAALSLPLGFTQAKEYAEMLGLKFAYASNGHGIVEFDALTGLEQERTDFPTPEELWTRLHAAAPLTAQAQQRLLAPSYHDGSRPLRYYQEIAVNRVLEAVLRGQRHVLLTMATGTGKTLVVFQICWKLWSSRWNRTGEHRRPRILYLADRNILVDDPKDKTFTPLATPATNWKRVRSSPAARCTLRSTRRWPMTRTAPASIASSRLASST